MITWLGLWTRIKIRERDIVEVSVRVTQWLGAIQVLRNAFLPYI